jgi:fucose 4-O-acetylase-like acetyltransferase
LDQTNTSRIDYIDLVKGFAILWIVWWHAGVPAFAQPYYHVPVFFFLSGLFFNKKDSFVVSTQKTIQRIGIPFLFFYTISYPYRMIVYLWDHRTLSGFRWNCILDLFKIEWRADYLYVNVPLWFLVCLFVLQISYFFINKLPQWSIWIIAIGGAVCFVFTQFIPTPLMINDAMHYITYFAIGSLVGKNLLDYIKTNKNRLIVILVSITVYLTAKLFISLHVTNTYTNNILIHVQTFSFIFFIISVFSFFNNNKQLPFLSFYGNNSIVVLGLHVPVLIVFQRIGHKLYGDFGLWGAFICTLCTIIILFPIILLLNRYVPSLIGKASKQCK